MRIGRSIAAVALCAWLGQPALAGETLITSQVHHLRIETDDSLDEGHVALVEETAAGVVFLHLAFDGALHEVVHGPAPARRLVGHLEGLSREVHGKTNGLFISPSSGLTYATYTASDGAGCFSMKLDQLIRDARLAQRPVYRTAPCVRDDYNGLRTGGRMTEMADGRLVLTVGDFGVFSLAQDDGADLGKILVAAGDSFRHYARGFRNSQGIHFDAESGALLATDMGPRAGDELNLVTESGDYGWPLDTYGTPYEASPSDPHFLEGYFRDRGARTYGRHDRFARPLYAWIPSIAPAQIARMPAGASELPNWSGDWLVAGMKEHTLNRLEIAEGRVVFNEPIEVGRIRDFFITPSGVIVASSTDGLLIITRDKAAVPPPYIDVPY